MIDLSNPRSFLGRVLKGESKAVEITAVVVLDHGAETTAKITEALKESGFSVENVVKNEDGSLMFPQAANPTEGAQLLRMSDDLLLVVKGLDLHPEEGESFIHGLAGYTQKTQDAIASALALEGDTGVKNIDEIVKKFGEYSTKLKTLPQKAFKADTILLAVMKMAKKKKPEPGTEDPAEEAAETAAQEAAEAAVIKKAEVAEVVEPEVLVEKAEVLDPMAPLLASMAAISESLQALTLKIDTVSGDVQVVKSAQAASDLKVDAAVKKADNVAHALQTTVLAQPQQADLPSGSNTQVKKADTDPRTGNFDTAFISRSRKT